MALIIMANIEEVALCKILANLTFAEVENLIEALPNPCVAMASLSRAQNLAIQRRKKLLNGHLGQINPIRDQNGKPLQAHIVNRAIIRDRFIFLLLEDSLVKVNLDNSLVEHKTSSLGFKSPGQMSMFLSNGFVAVGANNFSSKVNWMTKAKVFEIKSLDEIRHAFSCFYDDSQVLLLSNREQDQASTAYTLAVKICAAKTKASVESIMKLDSEGIFRETWTHPFVQDHLICSPSTVVQDKLALPLESGMHLVDLKSTMVLWKFSKLLPEIPREELYISSHLTTSALFISGRGQRDMREVTIYGLNLRNGQVEVEHYGFVNKPLTKGVVAAASKLTLGVIVKQGRHPGSDLMFELISNDVNEESGCSLLKCSLSPEWVAMIDEDVALLWNAQFMALSKQVFSMEGEDELAQPPVNVFEVSSLDEGHVVWMAAAIDWSNGQRTLEVDGNEEKPPLVCLVGQQTNEDLTWHASGMGHISEREHFLYWSEVVSSTS